MFTIEHAEAHVEFVCVYLVLNMHMGMWRRAPVCVLSMSLVVCLCGFSWHSKGRWRDRCVCVY